MKGLVAALGALCLSPLLLAGLSATAAAGSGPSTASSTTCEIADASGSGQVAQQVGALLKGKGAAADATVSGLSDPAVQIPFAQKIIATGIAMRIPERGQIVALATALQESGLRNLTHGDRDSLGLFQQRPSQGWGTAEEIRDPVHAAKSFYKALLAVPGWQQLTVTQAAQLVQKSGTPDAYAKWEPLSRALQHTLAKNLSDGTTSKPDVTEGPNSAPSERGCGRVGHRGGSTFGPIPEGKVPKGYEIPKDAPPQVQKAIRWAFGQLGTLYQWGGTCTAPRGPDPMGRCDCSSLMQQAYAAAGIKLTRTTYTQVNEGKPVRADALKPGDLLFSRGTASVPEHVGLYLGQGLVINAPRTTKPVRIEAVKDWTVLAVRRVVGS
ncbi:C40 family peptidase [Streptomyces sp. NPDC051561]|uniref:C40 family peptidase n=1 Tax=Streptomyces sp. NPDC051561 TaxID=3365658 RepID=UPI0037A649E5